MIAKVIALALAAGLGATIFVPNPQNLLTTFENGQRLYAVGEYQHAAEEYLRVVRFHNKAVDIDKVSVELGEKVKSTIAAAALSSAGKLGESESIVLPVRAAGWYQLGNSYKKSGQHDQAVEAYKQVLKIPGVPKEFVSSVQYQIAETRFYQEAYDQAADEYQVFLTQYPASELGDKVSFYKGWSLFKGKRYADAIEALRETLERYPRSSYCPEAQFRIGSSYFELGDYQASIGAVDTLSSRYPRSASIANGEYLKASAYDKLGRPDEAIAAYQHVIELYDVMYEVLRASFKEGRNLDFDEYERLFENSFLRIAEVYREQKKDYEQSYRTYFTAQERVKGVDSKARIQVLIGDNYMAWQRYEEAAAAYALAITNYPTSSYPPQAQYKVGEAYYYGGQFARAKEEYLRVLEKYPFADIGLRAASLYNAAWCAEKGDQLDDAAELYRRVVEEFPRSQQAAPSHLRLGQIYTGQGQLPRAVEAYRAIVDRPGEIAERFPDPAEASKLISDAHYFLGLTLRSQQDFEGAVREFRAVGRDAGLTYVGAQMATAQTLLEWTGHRDEAKVALASLLREVSGDPALEALAHFQIGQLALGEKDYAEALAQYTAVIESVPESDYVNEALYGRASANYSLGQFRRAADDYERLLKRGVSQDIGLRSQLGLALAYSAVGRDKDALDLLEVVGRSGDQELSRTARIQQVSLVEKESPKAAIEAYQRVLAEAAGDREIEDLIYPRLANAYYRQESYPDAIAMAERVVQTGKNPESVASAIYLMGNAYSKLEQYEKAISQFEAATKSYGNSLIGGEALFQTGVVYNKIGLGGLQRSIDAFERYARQYPQAENVPMATYYAAWGYYRLGDWEKAAASFDSFVERFPQQSLAGECLFRAGEALFNTKQFEAAISHFERLGSRYPRSEYVDAALYSHAWALINMHREADAVPIFTRIVAEYPHGKYGAQSQFTLGDYYYSMQQYEKATEEYRHFIQLFPGDRVMVPRAQLLLGNLAEIDAYSVYEKGVQFFSDNKYKEALEVFKSVADRYPDSKTAANARLNLGATYQALENYGRAQEEYSAFLSRYGANPEYITQAEFAKSQLTELKKVM